ncbi:amidohydrolase [Oscillospiraceae bacterium LTW-04]|nr:amidohydrolase [Oscillospiraceae bacterium MB24-C1]
MSRILIDNITVLTMDQNNTVYQNGYLLTDGDKIAALGGGAFAGDNDEYIDGAGGILLPGFVNTHCHVSMMPFRSLGDDCPDRLRRFLFPLENEAMTPRLVYLAAKYGICEMLLSGTTTFLDMYYFEDEVARACEEMGIRGYLGETIIGQPTCVSETPYGGFDYQRGFLEKYRSSSRIHPIIAPHGTTTCDEAALKRAHALAVEYDTLFTLHASEMDYEMAHFAERGSTPTAFLDKIGALDARTLLAHSIHANDNDLNLIVKRGAAVAHCIASNTKAGKGIAPVKGMIERGIAVGLGTDGASSGNTLSMFDQMRMFANCHKTANRDRGLFPAKDIVRLATTGGAQALHGAREYGQLVPGMQADLVLVETDSVNMFPVFDPFSALVYSANASNVRTVLAQGKVVVRDKELVGQSLGDIRAELFAAMGPFVTAAEKYRDVL